MKRFLLSFIIFFPFLGRAQDSSAVKVMQVRMASPRGGNSSSINIRCTSTLDNSCQPLIVVDGAIIAASDLSKFNPQQIESITILKYAAGTAIYGFKALNGVVVITLKKIKNVSLKIIDETDSLPIDKSTVTIYSDVQKRRLLRDEKGEIELPALIQEQEYSIEITAVGYRAITRKMKFNKADPQHIISLERNFKKMDEVVIASGGGRTIRCGGCRVRFIKSYTYESKKNADNTFGFSVFPNPVLQNQTLNILPKTKITGLYQVLSVSGQILQSGKVNADVMQPFMINIANYPAGSYIIRLLGQTPGDLQTGKFIIQ